MIPEPQKGTLAPLKPSYSLFLAISLLAPMLARGGQPLLYYEGILLGSAVALLLHGVRPWFSFPPCMPYP